MTKSGQLGSYSDDSQGFSVIFKVKFVHLGQGLGNSQGSEGSNAGGLQKLRSSRE
jgi:hypothetical protein